MKGETEVEINLSPVFHHCFDLILWFSLWATYNDPNSWMQYVGATMFWFLSIGAFSVYMDDDKISNTMEEWKNDNIFYQIYAPITFVSEVLAGMYLGWWSALVYGFFGILCYIKLFLYSRA